MFALTSYLGMNATVLHFNLFSGHTSSRFTPSYYHVLPKASAIVEQKTSDPAPSKDATPVATPAAMTTRQTGSNSGDSDFELSFVWWNFTIGIF